MEKVLLTAVGKDGGREEQVRRGRMNGDKRRGKEKRDRRCQKPVSWRFLCSSGTTGESDAKLNTRNVTVLVQQRP